jgi:carbamoyltransferase
MAGLKDSPYMMYAIPVKEDKLNQIPAVAHVDGTCRIQTVNQSDNLHYRELIESFYKKTKVPILFNTSFNLAGQPLVEVVKDAIDTMKHSEIKYLYLPEIKKLVYKD